MRLQRAIFRILLIGASLLCTGCVNSKPVTSEPSGPVAGLKPASQRAEYTGEQIIQLYLTNVAFGDWYLARLDAACDALAQDAATPEARYEALHLKALLSTRS
jgi:hypothetical protein